MKGTRTFILAVESYRSITALRGKSSEVSLKLRRGTAVASARRSERLLHRIGLSLQGMDLRIALFR